MIEAIVLSGGSASRLGRPKSLLALDGQPILGCVLAKLREAGIAHGVVVLGVHAKAVLSQICVAPFVARLNPHPEAGRTGSVQVGLDGVSPGADVLLWPIDRPFASVETVRALVAARDVAAAGVGWIVPSFEKGAGHPILLRARALAAIQAADADANLRALLPAAGGSRMEVPVEDAGIHVNVDTEKDWQNAVAWWQRSAASG